MCMSAHASGQRRRNSVPKSGPDQSSARTSVSTPTDVHTLSHLAVPASTHAEPAAHALIPDSISSHAESPGLELSPTSIPSGFATTSFPLTAGPAHPTRSPPPPTTPLLPASRTSSLFPTSPTISAAPIPARHRRASLNFTTVTDFVVQQKRRLSLSMNKMSYKQKPKKEEKTSASEDTTPAKNARSAGMSVFEMHPGTPVRYDASKNSDDALLEEDPDLKLKSPFERLAATIRPKGTPSKQSTPPMDPLTPSGTSASPPLFMRPPPPLPATPTRAPRNTLHPPTTPSRSTATNLLEQEREAWRSTDALPTQQRSTTARGLIGGGLRRLRAETVSETSSTTSQLPPRSTSMNQIEATPTTPIRKLGKVFGGRPATPASSARPPRPVTPGRPPVRIIKSPADIGSKRVAHFGYADMVAAGGVGDISAVPAFPGPSRPQANARYSMMIEGLKSEGEKKAEEIEMLKASFAQITSELRADSERKDREIASLKAAFAAMNSGGSQSKVIKSTPWEILESKGLLGNIFGRVEQSGLCSLARVSKHMKSVAEPFLYKIIDFSPRLPNEDSYAHLTVRLMMLLRAGNGQKLEKYTKYFRIGSGWRDEIFDPGAEKPRNQLTSLENIKDGELEWSVARIRELLTTEGVKGGDGGVKETKAYITAVLSLADDVETLIWDSPIPLKINNNGIPYKLPELKTLKMNLDKPACLPARGPGIYSYRPNIKFLKFCALTTLSLYNVATRDAAWWSHAYVFIGYMLPSLRHLTLEMPPEEDITVHRFPQLFIPGHNLQGMRNPVHLGWDNSFSVSGGKGLCIETLHLRGLIISEDTFDDVLDPAFLHTVKLIGCMRMKEWQISDAHARGIKTFETDGWGFLDTALRISKHNPKEIVFMPKEAGSFIDTLGKLVSNCMTADKLQLSAVCFVKTDALKAFVSAGNSVKHLEIALKREQWDHFAWALPNLRHVTHLEVFIDEGGKRPMKGTRRRFPADDAEEMASTLGARTLREVGVGGHAWAIKWTGQEQFKLLKIRSVPFVISAEDLAGAVRFPKGGAKLVDVKKKEVKKFV